MFHDLYTERLHLKSIGTDDAEFFYREFSNAEVNRYLYDAEPCASPEEAMEWITLFAQPEPRGQHRWVLIRKDTGERIGTCGFHCWEPEAGSAETGYDLLPEFRHRGYAAEEMGLRTVDAHISVDNAASSRTAEKLGFVKTGQQYSEKFRGREYPHDIYRLTL